MLRVRQGGYMGGLVLCDERGVVLPGQVSTTLVTTVEGAKRITVEFTDFAFEPHLDWLLAAAKGE